MLTTNKSHQDCDPRLIEVFNQVPEGNWTEFAAYAGPAMNSLAAWDKLVLVGDSSHPSAGTSFGPTLPTWAELTLIADIRRLRVWVCFCHGGQLDPGTGHRIRAVKYDVGLDSERGGRGPEDL